MWPTQSKIGNRRESASGRRSRKRFRRAISPALWLVLAMLAPGIAELYAQTPGGELQAMRQEIESLRQEVTALRGEMQEMRAALLRSPSASPNAAPSSNVVHVSSPQLDPPSQEDRPQPAEMIPMLQEQIAEQAQTKVESNSKLPVKIFGVIVSSTFFNTGEVSWLENPNMVGAAPAAGVPSGSFSSTLRQSRLGVVVNGPTVGAWETRAFLAADFMGGVPNFQTGQVMGLPRLLYAFVRLEKPGVAIEVGQDHMILAPKNPTSLAAMAFPDFYRSGNLYLRVPQARVERTWEVAAGQQIQGTIGILAPVGGDFTSGSYEFVPPILAGERSRRPAIQGRLAWRQSTAEEHGVELGFSGHYAAERYSTGGIPSWAAAVDFDLRRGRVGLGGEWFIGRNIDAFGGSLGQLGKSAGGFFEGRLKATSKLEFNGGVGMDRPFDFAVFPVNLTRNSGVFANTIYRLTPEVATSIEYRWLSTMPALGVARRNNHINFVLAYSF